LSLYFSCLSAFPVTGPKQCKLASYYISQEVRRHLKFSVTSHTWSCTLGCLRNYWSSSENISPKHESNCIDMKISNMLTCLNISKLYKTSLRGMLHLLSYGCLTTRMQNKITAYCLLINALKM